MAQDLFVTDGRILRITSLSPSGYEFREGDLPDGYSCTCLARDHGDPNVLYAVVNGDIYRSDNAGVNWSLKKDFAASALIVHSSHTTPGEVWVGVHGDGGEAESGVWLSTDYGENWSHKLAVYGATGWNACKWIQAHGDIAWAVFTNVPWGGIVFKVSADRGETWVTESAGGAFGGRNPTCDMCHTDPLKGAVTCNQYPSFSSGPHITLDGWETSEDRMEEVGGTSDGTFAPAWSRDGSYLLLAKSGGGIWKSTDNGATWTQKVSTTYIGTSWHGFFGFYGTNVYAIGTNGRLFYSNDHGESWDVVQLDRGITIKWILEGWAASASVAYKLVIY